MDTQFNIILANTYTTLQLKHRLRLLKEALNQKFFNQQPKQTEVDPWLSSLPADFFQNIDPTNADRMIQNWQKLAEELPILTLTIPFDIPDTNLAQITTNLRQTQKKDLILEVKHDPDLIAGCTMIYKGVLHDYSIKNKIEQNKQAILSSLRSYLK